MMGDNRDNSSDSRTLTQHGPVPAPTSFTIPNSSIFRWGGRERLAVLALAVVDPLGRLFSRIG